MGLDYCFSPSELYLTRKMLLKPEFVFPSKFPQVSPVTYKNEKKHTEKTSEDSIIGAVIGKKMVTDKGNITKFFCENCETPWTA